MKSISVSQALVGFDLAIRARRLSEHTRADYFTTFRKFQTWLKDDRLLKDIRPDDIRHFLDSHEGLSDKTISITMSACQLSRHERFKKDLPRLM